jgi:type IV pilus assembly protein PilO
MADFEFIERLPIWQRLVVFAVLAGLVTAGWYFVFYEDAANNYASAQRSLEQQREELARVKKAKEDFLERRRKQAELEAALNKQIEILPMSASTVDNLMQTFQQQARLVGLTVESWTPKPEEKQDFYARLPIEVRATGSWPQAGEFFRRVHELDRIVSVDNLELKLKGKSEGREQGLSPDLELSFEAATYRFLSDEERAAAKPKRETRRQSKRKGGKK